MTDINRVFEKMQLNKEAFTSIYKYAPVYKGFVDQTLVVLKRTKRDPIRGIKLMAFQKHLIANGVSVVAPIEHLGEYHHQIEEDRWTLYPFVEGEGYNGSLNHIKAAGDFLGRLHKCSNNVFNHGFNISKYDEAFIEDVIGDLVVAQEIYNFESHYDLKAIEALINKLSEVELPSVDGTWDYKANNLVFGSTLTLIDTDNSGYIPRVIDLALACILFNTECEGAPDRPFSPEEWQVFMSAYQEHISLSTEEKATFEDVLRFTFIDEGLYAMSDLEDDEPMRQKNFIRNMLHMDLSQYHI